MAEEPITDERLIGILAAIQILQEALIARGVTSAADLASKYDARAQAYFPDFPQAVAILEALQVSLTEARHRPIEALYNRKAEGSA